MGDFGGNVMDIFQRCKDISDIKTFYIPKGLYLKPVATINISVQFPSLRKSGNSLSSKILLEKIREMIAPDRFCTLKIIQSTVKFICIEGEIESRCKLQAVLNRLDGRSFILPNFPNALKVQACHAKPNFPTNHDWDTFFQNANNMDETKPGERPDTLHLSELPKTWFASKSNKDKPSKTVLWRVFEQFGDIQAVDIPCNDPYRTQMTACVAGLNKFSFNQDMVFDAYIQFKSYNSFLNAMESLRGMKLLKQVGQDMLVSNIKVDFDRTKHLSEKSIKKRENERGKIMENLQTNGKIELREKGETESKICLNLECKEKLHLGKKQEEKLIIKKPENMKIEKKVINEELLLRSAHRKLESMRLLTVLLRLIKEQKEAEIKRKDDSIANEKSSKKIKVKEIQERKKPEETEIYKEKSQCQKKFEEDVGKRTGKELDLLSVSSVTSSYYYKDVLDVSRIEQYDDKESSRLKLKGGNYGSSKKYSGQRERNIYQEQRRFYNRNGSQHFPHYHLKKRNNEAYKYLKVTKNALYVEPWFKRKFESVERNKATKISRKVRNENPLPLRNCTIPKEKRSTRSELLNENNFGKEYKIKRGFGNTFSSSCSQKIEKNSISSFPRSSSIHTWSRSPSLNRSPSWERI